MIGCSFVVDREYFGQIGLLDPGMEVYGGENIELGMRDHEPPPATPPSFIGHVLHRSS
ncbi:Polypeptide N-acetylgalactosaminyltransferase 9 [Takifugu flavidus]|uniref:Polypeptide N-acetylgalactosaminyltransferase 9 n=1 Tax=Takifugu flavidus TaxID=433684 RepID=A0A5C6N0H7_9TELE|nr:Polypeptide N-acetylgalactosaminyltransferase 9 [Takifugu flavidus]